MRGPIRARKWTKTLAVPPFPEVRTLARAHRRRHGGMHLPSTPLPPPAPYPLAVAEPRSRPTSYVGIGPSSSDGRTCLGDMSRSGSWGRDGVDVGKFSR